VMTREGGDRSSKVFINYYKKDGSYANRLYLDLKAASLNPWIDKENLLPGQTRSQEIEKAIGNSKYFVALMSTRSVNERGVLNVSTDFSNSVIDDPDFLKYLHEKLQASHIPNEIRNKLELREELLRRTKIDLCLRISQLP
jgi:hypothetical protein